MKVKFNKILNNKNYKKSISTQTLASFGTYSETHEYINLRRFKDSTIINDYSKSVTRSGRIAYKLIFDKWNSIKNEEEPWISCITQIVNKLKNIYIKTGPSQDKSWFRPKDLSKMSNAISKKSRQISLIQIKK